VSDPGALRAELAGRIMGFMVSQAVFVAAKLGIPQLLADGPRSVDELAAATDTDADALRRYLRLLAGVGIFREDDAGFANNELSELLGGPFRDFAEFFGELFYPVLGESLRIVREGEPAFPRLFGAEWDDYLAAHLDVSARFNRFMAGGKDALADQLGGLAWREGEAIVDVGGGNGAVLIGLLQRRQEPRGVVLDLPHVAPEARARIDAAGLSDRCEVIEGNYFDGDPEADAYLLSHILHGWHDERAKEILRNVRRNAPEHARLLIHDAVVAPPNEPGGKLMDLLMLSISGGRERTEEEWRALLAEGGFEVREIQPLPTGSSLIEAVPS
jgi:hypothetical protein